MHASLEKTIRKLWRTLKPKDDLTVAQWAERKRMLTRGKYYLDTAPYQKGPMDAATDSRIRQIVMVFPAQSGKTTVVENIVGYFIDHEPRRTLVVQPTLEMAKTWAINRLTPMANDSFPGVLSAQKSRDTRNTMLAKTYPGGDIAMVGANAPAGVASRDRDLVVMDETCRYPDSVGGEGDIEELAVKRTESYPDALIVRTSTPTSARRILGPDGQPVILPSRIYRIYNLSDKREWFCPCPKCGEWQTLKWANVRWEENNPRTAHYVCGSCKQPLSEVERRAMVRAGEWRATAPASNIAGFRLNALASPFEPPRGYASKLHELAEKFLSAKHDKEKLKAFVNLELGEDFIDYGETPDTSEIFSRREHLDPNRLPDGILVLTAGIDVQGDRLEMQIAGWGEGEECWIVDHIILTGNPQKSEVWGDLDLELGRKYATESGHVLTISGALIDSGDGKIQSCVYSFVKPRQGRRIYASKGEGRIGHPLVDQKRPTQFAKKRDPIWLVHIGTDTAKDMVFERAKLKDIGPRYIHFSDTLTTEWFNQFSSEERQTVTREGRNEERWVQIRARNEALDCAVMNFAALHVIRPRWELLKEKRATTKSEPEREPEKPAPLQHPMAGNINSPRPAPRIRRTGGAGRFKL